jgi:hypothetical protein
MKEYSSKTVTSVESVVTKVICNCCGKDITYPDPVGAEHGCVLGASFKISFGYGSDKDGDEIDVDMCNKCLDKWIGTFVHLPKFVPYF